MPIKMSLSVEHVLSFERSFLVDFIDVCGEQVFHIANKDLSRIVPKGGTANTV